MKTKLYPGAEMLEEPWYTWANVAQGLAVDITPEAGADRDDFVQEAILELVRIADKYKRQGKVMTEGSCSRALRYYRMHFRRDRARGRIADWSLNRPVAAEDGIANPSQLIDTIPDNKRQDWDLWVDAEIHIDNASRLEKRAIRNQLNGTVGRIDSRGIKHPNTPREEKALRRFRERWEMQKGEENQ